ncbi:MULTISPECIES: thiamine phosphate synthase [unclassified Microcoleus]|jgi:thiamine-phosphate pyrophosphorylase|uniref:thiamine phosphate synthase n=1 Tax=unclassified Microcoleus TaxID=2642155 RepID=UPI001DF336D0|nr:MULTISPECIES: thiamine phosphate synthase [unclassified Microcoleus]MCC3505394.1 thiamine phosphate synthase [Microcoleus sp. PH2017_19_SFW_U_A]MCC3524315.1 thiamine phosphate synthase [Microcoleus sp. PH2017_20_SFW_D_A]MCC3555031.1 thiamine phosphate synthase [Microcoleus sp. PH2017_35_SFW_U_B]TAG95361.1 MAG: thiamine phosphate synthase [Oscillatoriales cyanobacterium]
MTEKQNRTLPAQPALCRILDANLDRSREGLRIIEEWCRFGLNSADLAGECKQLRQELAFWHTPELRSARDTPADPGTELTHPQEEQRGSIQQLLAANFCRVEEALRVLEEYGKVYDPNMGKAFKQMRYRVYTLESDLLAYRRYQQLLRSQLYLVTSPKYNFLTIVEAALQGGVTLVQYRDKASDDGVKLANVRQLCELCHRYDALLIVNDRVDLAIAADADGVHLGQQDLSVAEARKLLGPGRIIGSSTTNSEEMQRAIDAGADYIGVGPVYETPTKANKPATGLDYVRYAASKSPVPWFAIGGIDINNLDEVLNAGAQRVATVRSIMDAEQPTLVTQFFISQLIRMQNLKAQKALQATT